MRYAVFLFFLLLFPGAVFAEQQFNRDLYFGLRNDPEVARLQEFLRGRGYFTYPQSTGNFFSGTLRAVRNFQQDQGISPVSGFFGPISRGVANRLLAGSEAGPPQSIFSQTALSSFRGKVVISSLSGTSKTAEGEQLILTNKSTSDTISITGFAVQNSHGASFTLPKGHELPGFSAVANDPIRLRPGDQALIALGKQERQINFRENLCTGYFDETSQFSPSLAYMCPQPDPRKFPELSDRCIQRLDSVSSCRMLKTDQFTDSACAAFAEAHYTYVGCVRDHRDRPDFYAKRWLVWMQRDTEFFRNVVEKVILRDTEGKMVDERSY